MTKNALSLTLLLTSVLLGPSAAHAQAPLTLAQVMQMAADASPALSAARQTVAQASARTRQAEAGRRFQITFNSTASVSAAKVYMPPPSQETFGTLQNTLTFPLPLGKRPRFAITQAQELHGAALAQLDSARLSLTGQVAAAYYDVLRKQALLAVAQQTLAENQRALSDVQKRNDVGDAAQLDVLQAQVPVASAHSALDGATNDLAVADETLNSLLGRPLDDPIVLADISPGALAPAYTLAQAIEFALSRSPDIRAAEATIRADRAALESARLFREPAYSLQAIDIRSKDVTSFQSVDTIQATVTLPLSDGGLGRAQIAESQAMLAGATAQVEVVRRTVVAGISAAYLTAQSRRRQVESARTARDIAQITYDKTTLGYRSGLFPLLQVLNARAALTQARIAYTQALYDAASAGTMLSTAFAGAVPPPSVPSTPAPSVAPPTGAGGTGPAGAGIPGTTPAGNSTTGPNPGGPNAAGRGGP